MRQGYRSERSIDIDEDNEVVVSVHMALAAVSGGIKRKTSTAGND